MVMFKVPLYSTLIITGNCSVSVYVPIVTEVCRGIIKARAPEPSLIGTALPMISSSGITKPTTARPGVTKRPA